MLALRSRAVILPALIQTKSYRIRPFSKITIRFGKPIRPEEYVSASGEICASEYVRVSELAFRQICSLADADFPTGAAEGAKNAGSGCPGSGSRMTAGRLREGGGKRRRRQKKRRSDEKSGEDGRHRLMLSVSRKAQAFVRA